ncbi:MAG: hypothetical protein AAB610_01285 [Patescibacteria group bacterium]
MKSIGLFFDKFKNSALKEIKKREAICSAIYEATGCKVEEKDISIKDCVIRINGSQSFKSELFMKKKIIIDLISKKIPEKVVDIR